MTNKEWLTYFDENCDRFKWLFEDFGYMNFWNSLTQARTDDDRRTMQEIICDVWVYFPDDLESLEGGKEFTTLLMA